MAAYDQLVPDDIETSLYFEIRRGGICIAGAPADAPPFEVEAVVFEQDRFLVLRPPEEVVLRPSESLVDLVNRAAETQSFEPGTVLVRAGKPYELHAVVHDLDLEPSWREDWIGRALIRIMEICAQHSFETLALPFLGAQHGSLSKQRALVLVQEAIVRSIPRDLRKIWLMTTSPPAIERFFLIE